MIPLVTLLTALLGAAAPAGPPWISIEYPVNPHDQTTRGAFLLVHVFHHGTPMGLPVAGTAEGLVRGERRTVKLSFATTSRTGVYSLKQMWPNEGTWTLVINLTQEQHGAATSAASAVVDLSPDGQVASVRVPTRRQGTWTIPVAADMAEIETGLRARAALAVRD